MTRPDPARPPHDLFDAIATLLEPCQREYFYQRMLYFRQLRPDDELLRIVEAIGFLALIIRDAPHAVAIEREHLEQLLATHRASVEATAKAARAHREQLDDRLTRLPADIAAGINAPPASSVTGTAEPSIRRRGRSSSWIAVSRGRLRPRDGPWSNSNRHSGSITGGQSVRSSRPHCWWESSSGSSCTAE